MKTEVRLQYQEKTTRMGEYGGIFMGIGGRADEGLWMRAILLFNSTTVSCRFFASCGCRKSMHVKGLRNQKPSHCGNFSSRPHNFWLVIE